jgi:hypothetical protein
VSLQGLLSKTTLNTTTVASVWASENSYIDVTLRDKAGAK